MRALIFISYRIVKFPDSVKGHETAILSLTDYGVRDVTVTADCENKNFSSLQKDASNRAGDILSQVSNTHDIIMTLERTISTLEMQLASSRASQASTLNGSHAVRDLGDETSKEHPNIFFVMGIMTTFSGRKRRDSIRHTWMPQGVKLKQLEKEKGIVIRFVIGRSATPWGVLDLAIDAEDEQHHDFLRLNHVEGYRKSSSKTLAYFSTVVAKWDADFFIKVDDDVHVNPGMIASILSQHRSKRHVYIGCMKSEPVLSQKGVKYHEPEFWKFGEVGNKYFRHAVGQLYAISKDLATYISINRRMLHKYANEDVSVGSWLIGLDVEQIDEQNLCCGTPPDCEWKAKAGNHCGASFDWICSGICKSVKRMQEVHERCGEGEQAIWNTSV
ncbi:Beta-1-3-galactosyltransferase [Nymphaea thermarum]|nr:Beta-1-3-galactosyltransferase [Nymphaea thermarum]